MQFILTRRKTIGAFWKAETSCIFGEMSLCDLIKFIFFQILVILNSTNKTQFTYVAYLELEVSTYFEMFTFFINVAERLN
jgi:hypothetical protein